MHPSKPQSVGFQLRSKKPTALSPTLLDKHDTIPFSYSDGVFMVSSQTELATLKRTPRRIDLNQLPGIDLHAEYFSARTGGDFFDARIVGSRLIFLLTDIAGRTPQAHIIAAEVQETFRQGSLEIFAAADTNLMDATTELVQRINHKLIDAAQGVCFAPTFVGCFDLSLGVLAYINAGGQPAVFSDSDGTRLLPNVSVPMGLFTHLTFEPSIQAFEAGAKLLVVTKGIVESQRLRNHFGAERVIQMVQSSKAQSASEISRAALQEAHAFRKLSWYSVHNLLPWKKRQVEDLTALAMVRPLLR